MRCISVRDTFAFVLMSKFSFWMELIVDPEILGYTHVNINFGQKP